MEGKSHLLIGLAAGVAFDSIFHVSGQALTSGSAVSTQLLLNKAIYYSAVGIGALLPDIDNARSTLGRKLGPISEAIQKIAGHRTLFHSILGLVLGSLLAIGAGLVLTYFLGQRGLTLPASTLGASSVFFVGVLFGSIVHILCDSFTTGGVPLFWPNKTRLGIPPWRDFRFDSGTWPEQVIVWSVIILVVAGVWFQVIII